MPRIETLINAYIDANIILFVAFIVWCLARAVVRHTRRRHDYVLHLKLTEGLMLAALISPVLAVLLVLLNGALFPQNSLNAADLAVAQFLEGRVAMEAEAFETLLSSRQTFVEQLAGLQTPLSKAIAAVLVLGFVVAVSRTVASVWHLRRLIRDSYVWRRFGRLDLRLSDEIAVPFSTRGLLRRHIVIPSGMLATPTDLRIALAHELQHMRRKDTEWELGLVLLRPFFFWNPAFIYWKKGLEQLRELGCDQVLLTRKRVSPRDYADCLLSVCRKAVSDTGAFNLVTPKVPFLSFGTAALGRRNHHALRDRITAIAGQGRSLGRSSAVFWPMLVVASLVIALGATTIRKPADWSQDRLMLSTIVNLERLETRNVLLSLSGY